MNQPREHVGGLPGKCSSCFAHNTFPACWGTGHGGGTVPKEEASHWTRNRADDLAKSKNVMDSSWSKPDWPEKILSNCLPTPWLLANHCPRQTLWPSRESQYEMEMPFAWWSLVVEQIVLSELREPFSCWWDFFGQKTRTKDLQSLKCELLKDGESCWKYWNGVHTHVQTYAKENLTRTWSSPEVNGSKACEMILKPTTPEQWSWMLAMLIVERT